MHDKLRCNNTFLCISLFTEIYFSISQNLPYVKFLQILTILALPCLVNAIYSNLNIIFMYLNQ